MKTRGINTSLKIERSATDAAWKVRVQGFPMSTSLVLDRLLRTFATRAAAHMKSQANAIKKKSWTSSGSVKPETASTALRSEPSPGLMEPAISGRSNLTLTGHESGKPTDAT